MEDNKKKNTDQKQHSESHRQNSRQEQQSHNNRRNSSSQENSGDKYLSNGYLDHKERYDDTEL